MSNYTLTKSTPIQVDPYYKALLGYIAQHDSYYIPPPYIEDQNELLSMGLISILRSEQAEFELGIFATVDYIELTQLGHEVLNNG